MLIWFTYLLVGVGCGYELVDQERKRLGNDSNDLEIDSKIGIYIMSIVFWPLIAGSILAKYSD